MTVRRLYVHGLECGGLQGTYMEEKDKFSDTGWSGSQELRYVQGSGYSFWLQGVPGSIQLEPTWGRGMHSPTQVDFLTAGLVCVYLEPCLCFSFQKGQHKTKFKHIHTQDQPNTNQCR